MSNLIKKESGVLAPSGVSSVVGIGLVAGGIGALPVWLLATMLPGGIFVWAAILIVAGVLIY